MRNYKSVIVAVGLILSGFSNLAKADWINFLSTDQYSFEDGGTAVYIQHPDYWSMTTEKAAPGGNYSMKYSSDVVIDAPKKFNTGGNGSAISFPAGTYTFKVKVWLAADAEISGFIMALKDPWTNFAWDFDTIAREQWIEMSIEKTFAVDVIESATLFKVDTMHGGKGTFYLDDIEIWGELDIEEPIVVPYTCSIKSQDDSGITLPAGDYNVEMKVWLDPEATISKFYTAIREPWTLMKWEMDTISTGIWVDMIQAMVLSEDAENSEFMLQVSNNPEFGGGKGSFFIDDIAFHKIDTIPIVDTTDTTGIASFTGYGFILYPNPATDHIQIEIPELEGSTQFDILNMSGTIVKSILRPSNSKHELHVSDLPPGIYLLKVISDEKILIERFLKK